MECTVKIKDLPNMTMLAETGSGHAVVMDGAPEGGGRNLGARPMEMLLSGLGGCSAYDVVVILRKSNQAIEACEVKLSSERAQEIPKVFTKIHFHFVVRGHKLSKNVVKRAIELSHQKYCSASLMLRDQVDMSHSFEIVESQPK